MPQSLSTVIVHIIFSTKNREPWLDVSFRSNLHAYLATVCRETQCEAYRVGGTADHVHVAARLGRTVTQAGLIEELKTCSSKWIKTQTSEHQSFSWQRGYGLFSVTPAYLDKLISYIDVQEEHHKTMTFKEEFVMFLKRAGQEYDERYVWD